MDANKCLELHHLRREILSSTDHGQIVIEFADGAPITQLSEARQMADAMIALVNLPMLGPHWFQIDRLRAETILSAVLHWDLETFRPRMAEDEAAELTSKILAHFLVDSYF